MGVEGGGPGGTMFLIRKNFGKPHLFLAPIPVVDIKHLRQPTPADIFYQSGFFFRGSTAIFSIERAENHNGADIPQKFLFGTAFPQLVRVGDPVTLEISSGFFVVRTMGTSGSSFGRLL